MKEIEVGDEILEFPDSMSDDEILQVLRREFPSPVKEVDKSKDGVFEAGRAAANIPGSAVNLAGDALNAIMNPIDTAMAVGDLGSGVIQKVVGEGVMGLDPENTQVADSVGQAIMDRYGSWDAAKDTFENDPVGAAFDIAGIPLGGGLMTGSKTAVTASKVLDPINNVASAARALPKVIPESVPESMYERAAKLPPRSLDADTRSKMIKTALREDIPLNQKGLDKLNAVIGMEMDKINGILRSAEAEGRAIPKNQILAAGRAAKNKIDRVAVPGSLKRTGQMEAVLKEFGNQWKDVKDLTPTQAQRFKQEISELIRFDKKQLQSQIGTDDARRAVRGALQGKLEEIDPRIRPANRRAGDLIELRDKGLEGSIGRVENLNTIGLSDAVMTGAGANVGDVGGAAIGLGVSAAMGPKVQSSVARALYKLRNSPMKDIYFNENGTLNAAGRQVMVQAGRLEELSEEEED